MILGLDHYWRDWTIPDGKVYSPPNWNIAYQNGVRFVFLKAADGIEPSLYFERALADARAAGMYVGAYVWLDARSVVDPKRQAEFWYSILKNYQCPISIDFEAYKDNIPDWNDLYNASAYYWQLDPTRNLGVYTNYWYWMEHGIDNPYFLKFFNWSARYSTQPPQLYAPWNRTDIWQFSGSGDPAKYGITNGKLAVDENWWMGDEASLKAFFEQGEIIPPIEPPIGETMEVKAIYKVNIRHDHSATSEDVGDFLAGQTAEVLEAPFESGSVKGVDYEQWVHIPAGWVAVWYRNQGKLCELTGTIVTPPSGSVKVEVCANGAVVHSREVAAGGTVRIDITD